MVKPTNPASASRAEKSGSHFASQQSTAGRQPNSARSAARNSRIDVRSWDSSASLAHSASNSLTGHESLVSHHLSRNCHVHPAGGRQYSVNVSDTARRDRLRVLLDAVVDADNADVGDMARSSYASEFHFSREVRRLTGESPAALRRRIMLERAAWRLHRGESVSAEVFSRAFSRTFGVPPSRAADIQFRLPAPNGLHFHPPQSLWLDSDGDTKEPDISQLMVAHDVADTAYLINQATQLSKDQWTQDISPGQVILDWDGPEPSVGAVLGAIVWTKEVWLATIEGRDFPSREATQPASTTAQRLAAHYDDLGNRW